MTAETVSYSFNDLEFRDMYFGSGADEGQRPLVVMVPDYHGVTGYAKAEAARLAEFGYPVCLVDLYGDQAAPASGAAAGEHAGAYFGDRSLSAARVGAAVEQARARAGVDGSRIAVVGFSLGAMLALDFARAAGDVAGVISVWGVLTRPMPVPLVAAPPPNITARVLVIQGALDVFAPVEALLGLGHEMNVAGADWELVVYGSGRHAFTVKTEDNVEVSTGETSEEFQKYDEILDARAHCAIADRLRELFDA